MPGECSAPWCGCHRKAAGPREDADLVMAFAALGWAGMLTHLAQAHVGQCWPCECPEFCWRLMGVEVADNTLTDEEMGH